MVDALEAGQQHLALVHRRIEAQVPIDVGVDDEVGRLRDDDLVVDDGDAERCDQRRLLHERVRAVGLAVAVGVLQHDDAVALGLAGMMRAVANPFGHPDAPVAVDVDVGRVVQQRRCGPQRDFEPVRHLEEVERNLRCGLAAAGACRRLHGRRPEGLLGHAAASINTSITFSGEKASRRISLPSMIILNRRRRRWPQLGGTRS